MRKIIAIIFSIVLLAANAYVLLDTFVLERRYDSVIVDSTANTTDDEQITANTANTIIMDDPVTIDDTVVYVAHIYLGDGQLIQSALAENTFGKNITDTTSNMAELAGATVATNGDFYGARTSGYVIRNGALLRATKASDDQEDIVLWADGTMSIILEGDYTAQELLDMGAVQVLSFGPGLIIEGDIIVTSSDEVGKAMESNPRTAIGYISANHYVFVVADGRTDESAGLSLIQLANFMQTLGVTQGYNLDGGGSSTMFYDGDVINNPTTNGKRISEREVSDILYVI